jgi:hypothetical protein
MDDSLIIGVRPEPGYVIITAAGGIDIFTVARLREQLFTLVGDGRPLIAGLERVTFPGAAGSARWPARPAAPPPAGPACTWSAPGRHSPSRPARR